MNPTTFVELNLREPLLRALESQKYTSPTPIQAAAIPHLLAGRDLFGCAQTGTGKTAAFALPMLQRLDMHRRPAGRCAPRMLVLSPTRELASQIGESFATYGRHVGFRQTVIFGGVCQKRQVRALERGVHLVVATPGRLIDLMEQGHLSLERLEVFVLDEADRMLDMGFLPALKTIIARLPVKRQSLFFSATLPRNISELADTLLADPVRVQVSPPASVVELIEQRVLFVQRPNKRTVLRDLLSGDELRRVLVFARTKRGAEDLADHLVRSGVRADAIHGNKSQPARERALQAFRNGKIRVLVATDVAARGIDVDDISHVINYDLPHEPEAYVHRIGRTGRAGARGVALSFCDSGERSCLRAIEELLRLKIAVDPNHSASVMPRGDAPRGAERSRRFPRDRRFLQQGSGQRRSNRRPQRAGAIS